MRPTWRSQADLHGRPPAGLLRRLGNQRSFYSRGKLSRERAARLEVLPGWSWDPHADQWEEGFSAMEDYVAEHGDAVAPKDHVTSDDYKLGLWVNNQRSRHRRGDVSDERAARLEALPGWVWKA